MVSMSRMRGGYVRTPRDFTPYLALQSALPERPSAITRSSYGF
jgi:hypothetical protein